MINHQNTLSQSYLKLLRTKSLNDTKNADYKKVFNHVKLVYKKDITDNSTTETIINPHSKFLFKADSPIRLS